MTKLPFKQHIADLASLLKLHGVRKVVICPGSRNAPLMQVFQRDNMFSCYSIVDERSAGYVALGMARELEQPVVVLTTSGTAALNLAPAVAEANNLHIPVIVLTADRPAEYPPQFTNQRILQDGIYGKNIKASGNFSLKEESVEENQYALIEAHRLLSSALKGVPGPLHLNIRLDEPLYEEIAEGISEQKLRGLIGNSGHALTDTNEEKTDQSTAHSGHLSEKIKSAQKILLLAGMKSYSKREISLLNQLADISGMCILAENLANLPGEICVSHPELILAAEGEEGTKEILPDLLLIFGGQVISKKTRLFVQGLEDLPVEVFEDFPHSLVEEIISLRRKGKNPDNAYFTEWKKREDSVLSATSTFMESAEYSALTAVHESLAVIPAAATVHLGNSSVVRLAQLCPTRNDIKYISNRGTSGIDGTLSAAVGAAMISSNLHVVILGDLSFVYDSNALWNRDFPPNLKIIVMNDKGGGIFRLLEGPDRMPFFEDFSVAAHPVSIDKLTEAFQLNYLISKNIKELRSSLESIFEDIEHPSLLEVDLSESENSRIFKKFYKQIQNQ